MNKNWKMFGYTIAGILGLAYLGFLFVLPNAVDINKFKPEIQNIVKEQANLSVDFENAKIITTPLLGVGLKAENISVKLPDDSVLFSADDFKTRVALPSLLVLTAKVSCLEINNPYVNLDIANNQFKVMQLVEDILNKGKEQKLEKLGQVEEEKSWFNPAWIRIKVPCVKVNNYNVLVNDSESKHYLKLTGEELVAGYFNGKRVKLKTLAELYSDENKNISANVNINTFLPPPAPALDEEDDPAERIDIPFINPVEMYRKYDLKANLDTKLRINNDRNGINSYGYFNIENITMKVSHLTLPESYLRAKTFGQNVDLDTNIYAAKDQNVELLGKLNYSSHPKMDMIIKTAEIKFNDMLILGKAFLDSLSIYNELDRINASGALTADCSIKTNFKKLKSNGSIIVKNGGLNVKGIGKVLADANVNLILDNSILDIKDSHLYVNESKVDISGKIDEKSVADINIKADKVPLPILFNAFAPKDIRKSYNFKSADATFELKLSGKLKNALATAIVGVDNLNFSDKASNFIIQNKGLFGEFFCNSKDIKGNLKNEDLILSLPKTDSKISVPAFNLDIANKNVIIAENKVYFNDKSVITYSGEILDFEKLKSITFNAKGNVVTDDIVKFIGKEFKPFIHSMGSIPVKLSFDGNNKKQTLFAQALADRYNFITPVDYDELKDKDTTLQAVVDFKANRIKIKNTGLSIRNISVDEKGNEVVIYEPISDVDGTIEGNRINLIKLTLSKIMHGKIYAFPDSSYELGGKAYVFGETASPRMRGGFEIKNLSIPELLLDLRKLELRFRGHEADIVVEDLILNGSDIQSKVVFSLLPSPVLNILNADVASRYFNLDRVMTVVEKAMKYVPQSGSPAQTSTPSDIPVVIQNGKIDFTRIITGNIDLKNTIARISLKNNIFRLHNLKTNVFKGNVNGNIAVNLLNMFLDIDVNGKNIDVEKAMHDACGMKDTLSGTAEFDADISLSGATLEEQMRSLKGDVKFNVKDGQFGPFAKLENLILAENIRESQFFQTAIGGMLSGLLTIDTTHFEDLSGKISFNDGICYLDPVTSLGDILSLHIFGEFDLLRNYADMKVRARMASLISNLLGPLGAISPANLLNSAASLNIVTAKAFSIFCEMVPQEELDILPSFANSYVDNSATKFQIVVRGDVAKPLTLVKSFKWLAGQTEYETAIDYVNSLPDPIEGSTATNIEEAIAEYQALEKEKQTLGYKIKHLFDKNEKEVEKTTDSVLELRPEAEIENAEIKTEMEIENNAQE